MNALTDPLPHPFQASAITARLRHHVNQIEEKEEEQEAEITRLKSSLHAATADLKIEKDRHAEASNQCESLRAEVEKLKEEAVESDQRQRLLTEQQNEMKKELGKLTVDNQSVYRKLESVEMKLKMIIEERDKLQKDFFDYKNLGPPLTEEIKQQIRQEYRTSPELTEEVLQQFNLGYQSAREKDKETMVAYHLNGAILDSSDEASDAEAEASSRTSPTP